MIGVPNPIETQQTYKAAVMPVNSSYTAAPANTQPVPQTGLIGSESALNAGLYQATNAINSGANTAISGLQSYLNSLGPQTAPQQSPIIIGSAAGGGGGSVDLGGVSANYDAANKVISGYNQGQGAVKMQADLSGANGPEAQQAAFAAYKESPALRYQVDQMQKVTERSAAARYGLLSGRVGLELQKNAQGLASQDYQNQFANLGSVAQTGLAAASNQAQIRAQQAGAEADLIRQKMANENNLAVANISGQYGLAGQSLAAQADLQRQTMSIRGNIASQIADIASSTGLNIAGLHTQTAGQLSQGRTNAGMAIAQNASQAASNISQLLANQGVQVSDSINRDISSITDMIYQGGMQDKTDMHNLAAILANINGGQASNIQSGYNAIGAAQAGGITGAANAVVGGIGNYLAYGGQPKMSGGVY